MPASVNADYYDNSDPPVLIADKTLTDTTEYLSITNLTAGPEGAFNATLPSVGTAGTVKTIILDNAIESDVSITNVNDAGAISNLNFSTQGNTIQLLSENGLWNVVKNNGVILS